MPLNWGKKDLYPLVVVLHDANSSAKNTIKSLGDIIHAEADSNDCVVLYPDAIAGHWNSKTGTSFPATDSINDAGFISIMVDFFIQQYHCDPQRLYVIGISNGGDMAKLLNCYVANKYAAIASINGDKTSPCQNNNTANILEVNAPVKEAARQAMDFVVQHGKK
jgi:polyhydroxybutyrate depolymerase